MGKAKEIMSGRDTILSTVRRQIGLRGGDTASRRTAVEDRLANPPQGLIPARGQLSHKKQIALFREQAESVSATVDRVKRAGDVPAAIAKFLRGNNLPQKIRHGDDPALSAMPWDREKMLEVETGPAKADDAVGVSAAFAGIAETGTLMLASGPDNPSTLNFLPETHIVVIDVDRITGDYESAFARLREKYGTGKMPRTTNFITGPSRSADIEQTLLLGAHGPKRLHIVIVDG